jgi:alpha-N-arabinofuranosidase
MQYTFDSPEVVKPQEFKEFKITEKGINFKIPPCSVISFNSG